MPLINAFLSNLPGHFPSSMSNVEELLLREYGSVFLARGGAVPPTKVVFRDEADVSGFQDRLEIDSENIGGFTMEFQAAAMRNLREAIHEARSLGLTITPRGPDSGRRTYGETVGLWASRVEPALSHWVEQGRLAPAVASGITALAPFDQVTEVLTLEESGLYFAKDLSKSIIYSVAPPGTSQHLSMLAFDVREFDDSRVRDVLARHYWYQTVVSDLPHFTFLGVPERDLAALGLKSVESCARSFWIPDLPAATLSSPP